VTRNSCSVALHIEWYKVRLKYAHSCLSCIAQLYDARNVAAVDYVPCAPS
jgi:hypothetical protein